MASIFRRLLPVLCVLVVLSQSSFGSNITWVQGSYPTVWQSEFNYLVSNGDLMYLHHVHSLENNLGLYYFLVRVAQSGNRNYEYRYLCYDWGNNRWEWFKASRSEGTRALEVIDGETSEVNEDKLDRWDWGGYKTMGWNDETDWTTVSVMAGWSVETMQAVCGDVNSNSYESKVKIFYLEDFDGFYPTGNPFDPNSGTYTGDTGGGDSGTGDTGTGDTGTGDTGGGTDSGDTVTVDGGMDQTEFLEALYSFWGSPEGIDTNGVDSVEIYTDDINAETGSHTFYEEDNEYPNLQQFLDAIEAIRHDLDGSFTSSVQDITIPFDFAEDTPIEFIVPLSDDYSIGPIVNGIRLVMLFFVVVGTGLTVIKVFMRAFT